jgi:hypothetical protein
LAANNHDLDSRSNDGNPPARRDIDFHRLQELANQRRTAQAERDAESQDELTTARRQAEAGWTTRPDLAGTLLQLLDAPQRAAPVQRDLPIASLTMEQLLPAGLPVDRDRARVLETAAAAHALPAAQRDDRSFIDGVDQATLDAAHRGPTTDSV